MTIRLSPEAEADAEQHAQWYDEQSPGLRGPFLDAVQSALEVIDGAPLSFQRVKRAHARRFVMRRFPFLLIYKVDDEIISVVAIVHVRRRPAYWRTRLQKNRPRKMP